MTNVTVFINPLNPSFQDKNSSARPATTVPSQFFISDRQKLRENDQDKRNSLEQQNKRGSNQLANERHSEASSILFTASKFLLFIA